MSTAQQTKPKTVVNTTTEITCEQSQKLVQTMLTMSFGCLAFLRGLFPDDNFVDQRFVPDKVNKDYNKNRNEAPLNSIKIKTLVRGKTAEADLFLDWLEKGVFQSIKLKYLKALSLGIFANEEAPTDLLEDYLFSFAYDGSGEVSISVNGEKEGVSLLDSRKVVQQLMRRFIIITQSLEPLPEKRFLTMRLLFNENAPIEYQPQFFRDASNDKPVTVKVPASTDLDSYAVGSLDTKYHEVSLKVLSVVDNVQNLDAVQMRDVDPFNLIQQPPDTTPTRTNFSQVTFETPQNLTSQTTNLLQDYLAPSAESIAQTQHLDNLGDHDCQCGMPCPLTTSKIVYCSQCKRKLHKLCYGNYHGANIHKCISCITDKTEFECSGKTFRVLMMSRRIYRYLIKKPEFPPSLSSLHEVLVGSNADAATRECINLSLSVLFFDKVLLLEKERRSQTSRRSQFLKTSNYIDIDQAGIFVRGFGELPLNARPVWSFIVNSQTAQPAYTSVSIESAAVLTDYLRGIELSLKKITEPENSNPDASERLGSSLDFYSLRIDDDTQESLGPGKRRHPDLKEYLAAEKDSQLEDTLDMHSYKAPKIRKISASKKTLKSIW